MEGADLIAAALAQATRAHSGQVDKRGRPYLEHLKEVAAAVEREGTLEVVTALLHDLLEDTTDTDLSPYPPQVREAVRAITRQEGETYVAYIERVAKNPLARTVKLADLRLNRATAPAPDLEARYAEAIARLERTDS